MPCICLTMSHLALTLRSPLGALAIVTAAAVAVGAVDVRVDFDKTFNFKLVRSWGWNPNGPGDVKMARTPDDDPEAARRRAEPIILEAVAAELTRRGLAQAASPDVFVTYYLLLTMGQSAQTMGQFLPTTPEWGLPPFAPQTTSLEIVNQGSVVLDISVKGDVVWRGIAQAKVKMDADDKKREALLREAVRDLLRRFPP
jgi:hypothetical protein